MSGYSGRSGVNVSQYLANLNTIPSPQQEPTEPQNRDEDFALFMNPDFFESFDASAGNVDLSGVTLDFDLDAHSRRTSQANPTNTTTSSTDEPKMDFSLNGDFQFADFSNFPNPIVDSSIQSLPHSQAGSFPVAPTYTSPVSSAVSPVTPGFDQTTDEAARVAAEEDKRRRNTAASARFRIKKKQREQALEKTAKEMSERVSVLETRIQQLETENTWLKSLITEKNGGKASTSELVAKLSKHEEANSERSTGNRTDGVGTKNEGTKA